MTDFALTQSPAGNQCPESTSAKHVPKSSPSLTCITAKCMVMIRHASRSNGVRFLSLHHKTAPFRAGSRAFFSSRSPAFPGCTRQTVRTPSPSWRPKHPARSGFFEPSVSTHKVFQNSACLFSATNESSLRVCTVLGSAPMDGAPDLYPAQGWRLPPL